MEIVFDERSDFIFNSIMKQINRELKKEFYQPNLSERDICYCRKCDNELLCEHERKSPHQINLCSDCALAFEGEYENG